MLPWKYLSPEVIQTFVEASGDYLFIAAVAMGNQDAGGGLYYSKSLFPLDIKLRSAQLYLAAFNVGEDLQTFSSGCNCHITLPIDDIFKYDLCGVGVYETGLNNCSVTALERHKVIEFQFYNWNVVPLICNGVVV